MEQIHFKEGDTYSSYWDVEGDVNDDNTQCFEHVIKDHDFYDKYIYEFATSDFFSDGSYRPTFKSNLEQMRFDKKLLGLSVEKQGDNMVPLSPKCYTTFTDGKVTRKV